MKRLTIVLTSIVIVTITFFFCGGDVPVISAPLQATPVLAKGWTKTWGGSSNENAKNVVADKWGNLYVVGEFAGTVNFDPAGPSPSATFISHNGTIDAFLSKFDSSGNFQWTRTWGGGPVGGTGAVGRDAANGVAVDVLGNVYVSGLYQSAVDLGAGIVITSNAPVGSNNIFVAKFSANGTTQWVRAWGGTTGGEAYSVAVDQVREYVYVQGDWSSNASVNGGQVDFNPGGANGLRSNHGFYDAFLSKYDLNGNFQWANTWGGHGYDDGPGVALDSLGNVYVGGMYGSTDINFDPSGATNTGGLGHGHGATTNDYLYVNVFLSKFNSSGIFQWVRTWGGLGTEDAGEVVVVDGANNVYVGGRFACTNCDFNPSGTPDIRSSNGDRDAFISKFDSSGNFQWARTWGGTGWDAAGGLAVDKSNNIYTAGVYSATVYFDPVGAGDIHLSHGLWDAFVSKFDSSGNFQWAKTWGGSSNDGSFQVAVDGTDNLYVAGFFSSPGTVDFDPGSGIDNHASNGGGDAFLSKFLNLSQAIYLPLITSQGASP